jgi:hypothetical protein
MQVGMQSLVLFALIVVGYAVPPAAWGLRVWFASCGLVALMLASTAVTSWQYEGPLEGLATASAYWFMVLATLGVGARVFWALANAQDLQIFPPRGSMLYRADAVLAALTGGAVGIIATLCLAADLRGATGGLALHLVVFAMSAGFALAALRLRGRLRALAVASFVTLASLSLLGGLTYPSLILSRAESILPGAPRCLRTPDGAEPRMDQLRLLTLPRAQPRRPNMVLTVMADGRQRDFRWSYRSFGFRAYDSYAGGPCPTRDLPRPVPFAIEDRKGEPAHGLSRPPSSGDRAS